MRNCLTLITIILCLSLQMANLHAQNRPVSTDNPPPPPGEFDPEMIYDFVSEFPTFPGGNNAKLEFINENLRYPQECIDKGIQGIVWLKVVIDKKGNVVEVKVDKGPPDGKALETEAIRIYKQMPRWNPGRNKNEPVNTRITEMVGFRLK